MPRRRHHSNNTAGDGRLQSAGNVMLMPARNAGAVTGTDPAAAMSLGYGTGVSGITGNITGVTPYVLGSYLNEFYQGIYRNIAPIWEVYERRDDSCAAVRRKRILKFKKELRNWDVLITEGFDQNKRAQEHREFLKRFYNNLRVEYAPTPSIHGGLPLFAEFAADSLGKQFAFFARKWERVNGEIRLTLKFVPLWFFGQDDGAFSFYPVYGSQNGTPVNGDEWVVVAQTTAIMEAGSVACLFKRLPMHQLVRILEKWGIPNVYGKTTAEPGSPAYLSLYNAVSAYISDMVAVISGDGELKPVESRFQAAALHRPWIDRMDRILAINWLGGDLGTLSQSGSGTLAGGAQADDVDDLISADCEWFTDMCQEQIAQQAISLEFGAEEPLAYFKIVKPDTRDDAGDRQNIDLGVRSGVPIGVKFYRERFSIPEPADGEETMVAAAGAGFGGVLPAGNAGGGVPPPPAPPADCRRAGSQNGVMDADVIPSASMTPIASGNVPVAPSGGVRGTGSGGSPIASAPVFAVNARRIMRTAQNDLDQLAANALPSVRKACAAILQPFFKTVADAADIEAVRAGLVHFKPDSSALAEILGQAAFAAILRGYVLDRPLPKTANNAGGEFAAPRTPGDCRRAGSYGASAAGGHTPVTNAPNGNGSAGPLVKGFGETPSGVSLNADGPVAYGPLPFDEARKFWANKNLIYNWDDLAPATYEQAVTYGFKVAGITEASMLEMIYADLTSAIEGQTTVKEFVKAAQEKYGLGAKHAETVIRTNVQTAYAWGHYQQLTDPAVQQAFPIWAFDVVRDENTSDICRPLAGKAYPANHPIWDSLYPPNHYNCRTTVFPLTGADEAAAQGFAIESTWPRDPDTGEYFMAGKGFEMNVGKVRSLAEAVS